MFGARERLRGADLYGTTRLSRMTPFFSYFFFPCPLGSDVATSNQPRSLLSDAAEFGTERRGIEGLPEASARPRSTEHRHRAINFLAAREAVTVTKIKYQENLYVHLRREIIHDAE